jgi:hypothetical protein
VDRVDDLAAVDALEVDGCDPEVGVPELALDDVERDAFTGHFDCVRRARGGTAGRPSHQRIGACQSAPAGWTIDPCRGIDRDRLEVLQAGLESGPVLQRCADAVEHQQGRPVALDAVADMTASHTNGTDGVTVTIARRLGRPGVAQR